MSHLFKHKLFILGAWVFFLVAILQPAVAGSDTLPPALLLPRAMELEKTHNLWWRTGNAAAIAFSPLPGQGVAGARFDRSGGSFCRPQQPDSERHLRFYTEKFTELENLNVWGHFSYDQNRDLGAHWADVFFPYNGNPYVFSGDRGGDWDKKFFHLSARVSSREQMGFLTYGAAIDYFVGSGARQNDPRPLNRLKQLSFSPSFVFSLPGNTALGLVLNYTDFREDVSIRIRNRDDNFLYFKLLGLGEHHTASMTSHARFYEGHTLGASVQVNRRTGGAEWIGSAGIAFREEIVVDGGVSGQSGGDFEQMTATLFSGLKWTGRNVRHMAGLSMEFGQAWGTEHLQAYNPHEFIWETIFSMLRVEQMSIGTEAMYSIRSMGEGRSEWSVVAGISHRHHDQQYLSPLSEMAYSRLGFSLDLRRSRLLNGNNSLGGRISLKGGGSPRAELSLHPYLEETGRNIVSSEVTMPDFDYLTSSWAGLEAGVHYGFFFGHRDRLGAFVKLSGLYITPLNDGFEGSRSGFSMGIGLNY